ncbi:MAG: hypothetical protein M1819_004818 [Sarea resinae]|nr:MAG: hypothetical protein M1819_004818 [Sarea resinae]
MGLPSKGEKRLLNPKAQEEFFGKIVDRYMKFCAAAGRKNQELDRRFASLSLLTSPTATAGENTPPPSPQPQDQASQSNGRGKKQSSSPSRSVSAPSATSTGVAPEHSAELYTITFAMRKLREAIVATHRTDTFAQRAYVFIIRACILTKHLESYHPALLHLFQTIHPCTPLSRSEYTEFTGYLILDLACRQNDLAAAHAIRVLHAYRERRPIRVVDSLVRHDWCLFWRMRRAVDGYQRRLVEFAEDRMQKHALLCLSRSYFTVEKAYVEKVTDRSWEELTGEPLKVGWDLEDGDKVVIRRPKARLVGGYTAIS